MPENLNIRLAKHTVPTCPLSSTPLLNYSDGLGYHSQFNIGLDASGRFFNEGVLTVGEGGTCVLCPVRGGSNSESSGWGLSLKHKTTTSRTSLVGCFFFPVLLLRHSKSFFLRPPRSTAGAGN